MYANRLFSPTLRTGLSFVNFGSGSIPSYSHGHCTGEHLSRSICTFSGFGTGGGSSNSITRRNTTLNRVTARPLRSRAANLTTTTTTATSAKKISAVWTFTASTFATTPIGITRNMTTSTTSTHPSLSVVSTQHAPAALGPYSQAIKVGDLLFCSGCLALDPKTTELIDGGVEAQTLQALKNMRAVLEAGGSELGKVVKTTVFLKSMNDFVPVNGVYASFFGDHKPARSAVEVARLPKDALVEVECIASLL